MNGGNCGNTNDVITTVVILWNVWMPSLIKRNRSDGRGDFLPCRDFVFTSTAFAFLLVGGGGGVGGGAVLARAACCPFQTT